MAGHDWSITPLGEAAQWPDSLRVAVSLCLSSDFPILVAWGPDLVMVYNEGYRAMLGSEKHPASVGRPVCEVWAEIWDDIAPLFAQVQASGLAFNTEHLPLQVDRNGYVEEAFFTFCYSPIDVGDKVEGILAIALETTAEVIADRRLGALGDLAAAVVAARDVTEVSTAAVASLGVAADLIAAEIRVWIDGQLVPLAASRASSYTPIDEKALDAADRSKLVVLDPIWLEGTPANRVALVVGSGDAAGVMVLTLNPLRPFDAGHRSWVELVGHTVGANLENAYRRSAELGEQRMISDTLQAAMVSPASDLPGVAARYRPAADHLYVGGDWYDVIDLPDTRRALVVGDCVGHGLHAATAMGQLRSACQALLLDNHSPAETVDAMDRFAGTVPGGDCATMACAIVDLAARTVTYSCAGHPPPLLVRNGQAIWLDGARSAALASIGNQQRTNATEVLQIGDLLILCTDGLIERRGEIIDDGLARLAAAAIAHSGEPIQTIADALIDELLALHPEDDTALVVKRVT